MPGLVYGHFDQQGALLILLPAASSGSSSKAPGFATALPGDTYFKFSALPGAVFKTLIRSFPDSMSMKLTVSPCFSTFMQALFGPSFHLLQ
jgi:hypothetical protein